ncbi:TPA: hypothetical protein ACIVM6_004188 [Salmonella enterica subsp. salamae serovar 21:z10:z6]
MNSTVAGTAQCPPENKPSMPFNFFGPVYLAYSTSGRLLINGAQNGFIRTGVNVQLTGTCNEFDYCGMLNQPQHRITACATITAPSAVEGQVYQDKVRIIHYASNQPNLSDINIWATYDDFLIRYRMSGGKPVDPDIPVTSCTITPSSLLLDYGALTSSTAQGSSIEKTINVTCSNAATINMRLSNTTVNAQPKNIKIGSAGIATLGFKLPNATAYANRVYNVVAGTTSFIVSSSLETRPEYGHHNANDVLTILYE